MDYRQGTSAELLTLRDGGDIVRHDVITRITLLNTQPMFAHEKGEHARTKFSSLLTEDIFIKNYIYTLSLSD